MNDSAYSLPEIYEVGFSFRNYPEACDFITEAAKLAGLEKFDSMLELGCGPGQYCREFASRGIKSFGLDLSPEMVEYLRGKSETVGIDCTAVEGDFLGFSLPTKVPLAVCMMATAEHILTNRNMIDHLSAVADNLTNDGLYIMELSHPNDMLTHTSTTSDNAWTLEVDGLKVTTDWGCGDQSKIDPTTEITDVMIRYVAEKDGESKTYEFRTKNRPYTAGLIRALVELSGRFKIVNIYGDLNINQPFDNSKKAWRMILVLRKWE